MTKKYKNCNTPPHPPAEHLSCNINQVPTFSGADKDELQGEVVSSPAVLFKLADFAESLRRQQLSLLASFWGSEKGCQLLKTHSLHNSN